ncbi:MAG: hypothetical protein M1830_005983 [Pleopsidium flavum]|nr:MAG: hypothetical protein M1830_005983 [Pleopsidium flavum]
MTARPSTRLCPKPPKPVPGNSTVHCKHDPKAPSLRMTPSRLTPPVSFRTSTPPGQITHSLTTYIVYYGVGANATAAQAVEHVPKAELHAKTAGAAPTPAVAPQTAPAAA